MSRIRQQIRDSIVDAGHGKVVDRCYYGMACILVRNKDPAQTIRSRIHHPHTGHSAPRPRHPQRAHVLDSAAFPLAMRDLGAKWLEPIFTTLVTNKYGRHSSFPYSRASCFCG